MEGARTRGFEHGEREGLGFTIQNFECSLISCKENRVQEARRGCDFVTVWQLQSDLLHQFLFQSDQKLSDELVGHLVQSKGLMSFWSFWFPLICDHFYSLQLPCTPLVPRSYVMLTYPHSPLIRACGTKRRCRGIIHSFRCNCVVLQWVGIF